MEEAGRVGPYIARNSAPAPDLEEVPDPPNSETQNLSMVLWDTGMNGWAGPNRTLFLGWGGELFRSPMERRHERMDGRIPGVGRDVPMESRRLVRTGSVLESVGTPKESTDRGPQAESRTFNSTWVMGDKLARRPVSRPPAQGSSG
jgi:hypothetical protein